MYRVELEDFEGPLDLLLLLINRREIDIFDIPIAQITSEYLSYVELMESINLDGVADYIYFAALLISIKARMLLPKPKIDAEEEDLDPRQQLVDQLLEYIRYKDVAEALNIQLEERSQLFTRGQASRPPEADTPEQEILVKTTIFDLINALRFVLEGVPDEETYAISRQEHSVEGQSEFLRRVLFTEKRVNFSNLVRGQTRAFIVATFLAVLEMVYAQEILVSNIYDDNTFVIERELSGNEY
ncbi:MAG: segregation/condensation protein A [Bacteroidetes bacterium]|nr:segregation/condensation protein A [Bacteroidota bacterium]MCY4205346.1 segregation/condensation protein A [Bacteroidota bacterium]